MQVRRTIVMDTLTKYSGKKQEDTKLLDFGCGSGYFVEVLAKDGFDAYGLDISSEAVNFGQSQGIKNLGVIDAHQINFPGKTFDVVLTLDVLEHLENSDWALAEMERVLKPGGIVIVMVPAYMFLWGVQDEVAHHYRRYTKELLFQEVKQATSLEVVRASYFNTFLFAPIAAVRLVSRLFGVKGRESDFDLNNAIMNRILFSIFNTERKLLKKINYPFGVSVLAILKKR